MIEGIFLIILGVLAAPSLLLSKKPNAAELLDKIVPYQGILGVIAFIYGIFNIFGLIAATSFLSVGIIGIIFWILYLALVAVELILGFMLGYGLIAKYVLSKNEVAKAKGEEVLTKLAPMQGKLGIVAIIVGVAFIVLTLVIATVVAVTVVA